MDRIDRSEFGNVLGDTSQLEFVDRGELDRYITCVCVLCLGSSLVDMTSFVSVDDMVALLSTCVDISSFESVGDKAALLAAYVDIISVSDIVLGMVVASNICRYDNASVIVLGLAL